MDFHENQYHEIIVAFLSGEATHEEMDELNTWIESSDENKQLFNEYLYLWQVGSLSTVSNKHDVNKAWDAVNKRIEQKETSNVVKLKPSYLRLSTLTKYAAAILLFAGLSYIGVQYTKRYLNQETPTFAETGKIILQDGTEINLNAKSGDIKYDQNTGAIQLNNTTIAGTSNNQQKLSYKDMGYNTIIVPYGFYYKIILPDGTAVWVNSGSKLKYYSAIPNDKRLVELDGEAFFEVTPNKNLPFVVKTNGQEAQVLGTSFNIKSTKDINATTLVTGSLQIEGKKDSKTMFSIKIKPGEQAVYSRTKNSVKVTEVDTDIYCSWKDGFYTFMDTPFRDVVDIISKNYGIEIELVGDQQTFDKKISGKLIRNNTINQTLDNLKLLLPFDYKFTEKKIIIFVLSN